MIFVSFLTDRPLTFGRVPQTNGGVPVAVNVIVGSPSAAPA
jgi:hypothetical protein